jgi:hypothetical protein
MCDANSRSGVTQRSHAANIVTVTTRHSGWQSDDRDLDRGRDHSNGPEGVSQPAMPGLKAQRNQNRARSDSVAPQPLLSTEYYLT